MKATYPASLVKFVAFLVLLGAFASSSALAALLPPDDYIGDAAIYAGVPSSRPKPNILLIIDTSLATLNPSPGKGYDPSAAYTGSYISDRIYYSDQQGDFSASRSLGGGNPVTLSTVDCVVRDTTNAIVLDAGATLSRYGTYSGAGSDTSPNLGSDGTCATAPNGVVYATGRYLNYANTQSTALASSCDNRTIVIKYKAWPSGLPKKYKLIANIIGSSTAAQEPGVGADWEQYWSLLPETSPTAITYEIDRRGSFVSGYTGRDGWKTGVASLTTDNNDSRDDTPFSCTIDGVVKTQAKAIGYYSWDLYYALTAAEPNTQRQAFYKALEPVIRGASSAVNFGFMTYNRNNQGAVVGADILSDAQSKDPVQIANLINKLPSMANCTRNVNNPSLWSCPDTIASGPNRPQSEALYDAGFYFMAPSLGATYKATDGSSPNQQNVNVTTHVPNPNLCGYNHIIFLTNGLPNQDSGTPNLGDWDGDGREKLNDASSIQYGLGTHLLDDVAAYLKNEVDLRGDKTVPGKGGITTHVILAFQAEDALMRNTATAGGGEFYNAYNTEGLSNALLNILANIVREADTSFVAPVVPASSTNRTRSGQRVYLGLFKPQTNAAWHGNLKKYQLSSSNDLEDIYGNPATNKTGDFIYSQSFWGTGPRSATDSTVVLKGADEDRILVPSTYTPNLDANGNPTNGDPEGGDGGIVNVGGAGGTLLARDFNTRNIFTIVNGSKVFLRTVGTDNVPVYHLNPQQVGYSDDALFTPEENLKRSQLIDYVYGFDSYGVTYSVEGQSAPKRKWVLGDILHSKPLVHAYWPFDLAHESVCYNGNISADGLALYNSAMVYAGTNDGMLHAFNDCDGSEEWAFIPPLLVEKLRYLSDGTHDFFMDSSPVSYVYDADSDGKIESGDKIILVFGLRRGGGIAYLTPNDQRGAYYMLDVTDPRNPQYLGEISSSNPTYSELGETWSQPVIDWIQDGTTAKLAMFVGAGYDNNEDLRWGNTQKFPDTTTFSNDGNFANDTDTTVPTNDGEDGGGSGVTSLGSRSQYNPKGRGVYIIELGRVVASGTSYSLNTSNAGSLIKAFTAADTSRMNFAIPSDLAVVHKAGGKFVDRIYVGDTGGQLWRIDVQDTDDFVGNDSQQWTARVIFNANPGADTTVGRKFFYRPDVGWDGAYAYLIVGSGDREHPLNKAVKDRLYMIRDRNQTVEVTESNLKDLTANELQNSTDFTLVSGILSELASTSNYGWYIKLEGIGEKMLADPVLFFGEALYTTYKPLPPAQDSCEVGNLGVAQLYHVDVKFGTAVVNYDKWNDSQYNGLPMDSRARGKDGEVLMKSDRVMTLGEGIPSGIVPLVNSSGEVTLLIAASGKLVPVKKRMKNYYQLYWTETILKD